MLVQKQLPYDLASNYISSTLEAGGVLSKYILSELECDHSFFTISSFLPDSFFPENNMALRAGGLLEKEDISEYINSAISDEVFAVLDDVMASADDIDPRGDCTEIYNGEIYHYISCGNKESSSIREKVLASSTPWHQLIVFFRNRGARKAIPSIKDIVSPQGYNELELVEVILGAFDGEGYIHLKPCS